MSVTINARGTSVSSFTIGKNGLQLSQAGEITAPLAHDLKITLDTNRSVIFSAGNVGPVLLTTADNQDLHLNTVISGGFLLFNSNKWPDADGTSNQVLITNGNGILSWASRVTEAPVDTLVYGRKDAAWVRAVAVAGDTMTGSLLLPNGTVTTPSLAWSTNPGFGFYSPSSGRRSFSANGIEVERLGSNSPTLTNMIYAPQAVGQSTYTLRRDPPGTLNTNLLVVYNNSATNDAGIQNQGVGTTPEGRLSLIGGSVVISSALNGDIMNWVGTTKTTTALGPVVLAADPTTPLQAATKQYVDAHSISIPVTISQGGTSGTTVSSAQTNLNIALTTFDDNPPPTPKLGDRWVKISNMTELVWAPNAGEAGIWINPAEAAIKEAAPTYPITISQGGTGATTASGARISLGVIAKTGDTMTGLLTLSTDPTLPLHAATKQYVDAKPSGGIPEAPINTLVYGRQDAAWARSVAVAGDIMTGLLTLSADPTSPLHAATKQYIDNGNALKVNKAGDDMSGPLRMANGTAAIPSISFTGSTNYGIYYSSSFGLAFSGSGTQRMSIGTDITTQAPIRAQFGTLGAPSYSFNSDTSTGLYRAAAGLIGVTGDASFNKASPTLTLNKTASGQSNSIQGYTNGSVRWVMRFGSSTAESGSNIGSDFVIDRYSDTGVAIATALTISRSNGDSIFSGGIGANYINAGAFTAYGATPSYSINKNASGQNNYVLGLTNGVNRWAMNLGEGTAEAGTDAGSDFLLSRYSDTGVFLGNALFINRKNGIFTFGSGARRTAALGQLNATANVNLELSKTASGQACQIVGMNNGVLRWVQGLGESTAETGSNLGSDYQLTRYLDDGTTNSAALAIRRDTGAATMTCTSAGTTVAERNLTLYQTNSAGYAHLAFAHPGGGKILRVGTGNNFQILDNAYSSVLLNLTDTGGLSLGPGHPMFIANAGNGAAPGADVVNWGTVTVNRNNNFNASNGRFTATISGIYYFKYNQLADNASAGEYRVALYKNGAGFSGLRFIYQKGASSWFTLQAHGQVFLNVGDYVTCRYESGPASLYTDGAYIDFCGHLIG
jgi:C1q domain